MISGEVAAPHGPRRQYRNFIVGSFDEELVAGFSRAGIEFGILVVLTADPAAVSEAAKLLTSAKRWAKAGLRSRTDTWQCRSGIIDASNRRCFGHNLSEVGFRTADIEFFAGDGLKAIPQLTSADFEAEHGFIGLGG